MSASGLQRSSKSLEKGVTFTVMVYQLMFRGAKRHLNLRLNIVKILDGGIGSRKEDPALLNLEWVA
jgi:hypothetical protein